MMVQQTERAIQPTEYAELTKHVDVQFYNGTQEDPRASMEAGRPIFKDVEMVRLRPVGRTDRDLHAPANARSKYVRKGLRGGKRYTYAEYFWMHYEAFKAEQEQKGLGGTPLSELTTLTEAKRKELRAKNVHTVEALANLDGHDLKALGMDARQHKTMAAAYLERASGAAVDAKHAAEMEAVRKQMADMAATIEALKAQHGSVSPVEDHTVMDDPGPDPFENWEADDLRNYVKDRGEKPAPNLGLAKLRALANEVRQAEIQGSTRAQMLATG